MATASASESVKPLTVADLRRMKAKGEKIASLTAYDASFAALEDRAGVDLVLVGDSLGNVIQGHDTTIPVTVDEMVYHSRCVVRGLRRALPAADLPFLSYTNKDDALRNAARLMQEGGARVIKLEGDESLADIVHHLASHGVPVCAHIGLQPQFVHKLGGFSVQGRETAAAEAMRRNAQALEDAGADILLIECVPQALAAAISEHAEVPVIGIGAGADVDGQILVVYDILDITVGRKPRFVKSFIADQPSVEGALSAYVEAVRQGAFPGPEHVF